MSDPFARRAHTRSEALLHRAPSSKLAGMSSEEVTREQAPEPASGGGGGSGGGVATAAAVGAGALLLKSKGALALIKALPVGKLLPTLLSMGAMVWFEAMRSGLPFALGFVLLILVHELGHGFAIKRAGLEAGWPVFIPFFGAMIALR